MKKRKFSPRDIGYYVLILVIVVAVIVMLASPSPKTSTKIEDYPRSAVCSITTRCSGSP